MLEDEWCESVAGEGKDSRRLWRETDGPGRVNRCRVHLNALFKPWPEKDRETTTIFITSNDQKSKKIQREKEMQKEVFPAFSNIQKVDMIRTDSLMLPKGAYLIPTQAMYLKISTLRCASSATGGKHFDFVVVWDSEAPCCTGSTEHTSNKSTQV